MSNSRVLIAALAVIASVEFVFARPNFLFVLTDDQDTHMESLKYMPQVQEHLISKGATFNKHYCTVAVCCPSRANIWTGQLSHNTNITNVQLPWGGYSKFIQGGYNDKHLALWLNQAGYSTYYAGKLFNGHTIKNYDNPHMSGYNDSAFFLEPYTYQYFNVSYSRNGQKPTNPEGKYSTDLLSNLTRGFIDDALDNSNNPFFITVAPVAPHGWLTEWQTNASFGPPLPAPRHKGLFKDYKIPRTENFNPEEASSVNWISKLERLNDTVIEYNDEFQRLRLRSLAAVDDMVGDVVRKLEEKGVLDNTYFIYSSDNGFHISQHRMHPGKMCGLETDINVPMIIRGPGIEAGSTRSIPSSHTDLAPTLLQLAGESIGNKELDGAPMDLGLPSANYSAPARTEHVAVEFWGPGLGESKFAKPKHYKNNTYKGLRLESDAYGFYYSVWCNNARELYNMKNDSGQLNNLLSSSSEDGNKFTLFDQNVDVISNRLDALLMVLKSCKEDSCRDPWRSLHPDGKVSNLSDALRAEFDSFYKDQPKIAFDYCANGLLMSAEGPQNYTAFGADAKDGSDGEQKRFMIDGRLVWTTVLVLIAIYVI
ncbi:unnamed protein product [Clonostachys solani]|uniref:Arylsulfatase n=1 Tax=Clonostachys solani TaxID=160281 RepID=A0A9N9Z0I2_9HYPO|nr:unnamed protein product [Clonostachys solani]